MSLFPIDGLKARVVKTFESLGFQVVGEDENISMVRENPDGTRTPLTIPNQPRIKGSTLRVICSKAGISRDEFLTAYEQVNGPTLPTPEHAAETENSVLNENRA